MILVIHCPKFQDDPSTIYAVLDIKREQLYKQLKAKAENFAPAAELQKIIDAGEKAGQLKKLEFSSIMAQLPEVA